MTTNDIYQTVTNAIITALEQGQTADKFQLPWCGFSGLPVNASTDKTYRGINIPMLWIAQIAKGFSSSTWATYKQWQEQGAQVKKGEKGSQIVFWKALDVEPEGDNTESASRMFARWSVVFNADQVEGYTLPAPTETGTAEIVETAEAFLKSSRADIRSGGMRAYYSPKEDFIALPHRNLFLDTQTSTATENYYSTALHELTHWSGAEHRLNRPKGKTFGDADYAFEELVAELGAAMLSASLGLTSTTREDHAQYIDCWLKALKNDRKFIFSAASQAQKAADYLHGLHTEQ